MSRMLKALQRIEARSPQPWQRVEPVSLEELGLPPFDPEIAPDETPETDATTTEPPIEEASQIASVPFPEPPQAPADAPDPWTAIENALAETLLEETPEEDASPRLRWPVLPSEEHARAYGRLAESILSQHSGQTGAALMFTSPGDGEGKTGTVVPLAAMLAQRTSGEVLLVDGNLHQPALADYLAMEPDYGLTDVLLGTTTWQQAVHRTVVPRLSVLPGVKFSHRGGRPPARWDLEPLLEELRAEYPWVLIDTASLAHREVAPMASCCTGVYLVVRLGQTARRAIAEAARVIADCRGRLLGGVMIAAR
ncbi:MAG TPA: CpsD/CapB family tyrosine-protein kinase [Thermoguttaceae bacterium]|nr:CpsD/CapB family tyrosine-protein kinase [Thermoguttaceae bacterium]